MTAMRAPNYPEHISVTIRLIPLGDLSVDHRYQVPISKHRVAEIKREFDPLYMPPLTVSLRHDGKMPILDGQHRREALVELGFESATCEVLEGLTYEQEAQIFAVRNQKRRKPKALQIFNAFVEADIHPFAGISRTADGYGYSIPRSATSDPKCICCPDALLTVYSWGNLQKTLSVLKGSWYGERDSTRGDVILGIAAFLKNWREVEPPELIRKLTVEHLSGTGLASLFTSASNTQKISRDKRLWAHFLHELWASYNLGRRNGKLEDRPLSIRAKTLWRTDAS